MEIEILKDLLRRNDPGFWHALQRETRSVRAFEELFLLSSLRKKALARNLSSPTPPRAKLRLAMVGAYSLYPLHELVEHLCAVENLPLELWQGDYDNYISEITDAEGELYRFNPQVVVVLPAERRCVYTGQLTDSREAQQAEARHTVESLWELARVIQERAGAEVIMTNFLLPSRHDLGAFRSRTLGSDWSFRKWVNLEFGLGAPAFLHICDWEFLSYRLGGLASRDERSWFESKQPCSPALLVELAREIVQLILSLKRAPKKVLALDLDNTLWGGVVADDGLEGIVLGDTSPRGEAFKTFQKYIRSLKQRGVLLAVCSKNDYARAAEPFEKHPDMVLKLDDFVAFKANWEPKSDNLKTMAAELNLGLDSFVFVDDNPAEIEIVRQFVPEVTPVLLGPDPSEYAGLLADSRLFEPRSITREDAERTNQYRSDAQRQALAASITDMPAYLESLRMKAVISEFRPVDVPRLAQLINKSNQFNLTTRRRSESEVAAVIADPECVAYSMRLGDRFGDYGLISIVIGRRAGEIMEVDTWLMSCRVLKRQVEEEVLNELARLALARQCRRLRGIYLPTPKNDMVRDFYGRMGFTLISESPSQREFELRLDEFRPIPTKIEITRRAYEPS